MQGLADIALTYFLTFLCSSEGDGIDPDLAVREMESFPDIVKALTPDERAALSIAAQERLAYLNRPPDEYGYKPGVDEWTIDVLESFADGTFGGWIE